MIWTGLLKLVSVIITNQVELSPIWSLYLMFKLGPFLIKSFSSIMDKSRVDSLLCENLPTTFASSTNSPTIYYYDSLALHLGGLGGLSGHGHDRCAFRLALISNYHANREQNTTCLSYLHTIAFLQAL